MAYGTQTNLQLISKVVKLHDYLAKDSYIMSETYIIVGPNGVGKSTLTDAIVCAGQDRFRHIAGSTVLKQALGVTSYDELRQLPNDHKDDVFNTAMTQKLSSYAEAGDTTVNVVDTHLLMFDQGEVTICVRPWVRSVSGIAAVTASPKMVLDRIKKDSASGTRQRSILPPSVESDEESEVYLAAYMEASRNFAHSFGQEHRIPVLDIDNTHSVALSVAQFMTGFDVGIDSHSISQASA